MPSRSAARVEYRIDVAKGYRLYATRTGKKIILLLAGGTKKTQAADIAAAQAMVEELAKDRKEARKGKT